MQFLTFLALVVTTAMAAEVTVHNNCATPIWLKPDAAGSTGTPIAIPANAAWVSPVQGYGNALKFASSRAGLAKPIQFDYTVNLNDGFTYYDVTNGSGQPFPLIAAGENCPLVACPGETNICQATMACGLDKNLHVYACDWA